jgi:hypothetical protein
MVISINVYSDTSGNQLPAITYFCVEPTGTSSDVWLIQKDIVDMPGVQKTFYSTVNTPNYQLLPKFIGGITTISDTRYLIFPLSESLSYAIPTLLGESYSFIKTKE